MPARRCTLCGINYPVEIVMCALHEEINQWIPDVDEDPDWKDRAYRIARRIDTDREENALIPSIDAEIKTRDSRLVLHSWDVIAAGIRHRLRESDLIKVRGQVYEVIAYYDPDREYWVRLFSMSMPDKVPPRWRLSRKKKSG